MLRSSTPAPRRPRPTAAVLLLSLALCALCGPAHGFWFSSARAKSPAPQWFGIRDYAGASQAAYSYDSSGGVTVAVPVAVPLAPHQLQVSPPYPGLGTVQLVPCLCPISKDPDSVKPMQSMQSMQTMQGMPGLAPASVQAMQTVSSMQAMPPVQQQASAAQPAQQHQQHQQHQQQ